MEHWIGILGRILYEGWTKYLRYLFSLLIDFHHEASYVSTLQDNIMGNRFSMSFRLVWDPGITLNFSLVQLVDHMVEVALIEDKQYLVREDCNVSIFRFPYYVVRVTSRGLSHPG
jgi:hypothetical protein